MKPQEQIFNISVHKMTKIIVHKNQGYLKGRMKMLVIWKFPFASSIALNKTCHNVHTSYKETVLNKA